MKTKLSPSKLLAPRNVLRLGTILLLMAAATCSRAVTVVSGPAFTPASNAPLAGVLTLTTDTASQVSVSVNDGIGTWERDFFDYGVNHSITLLGCKPNRTNEITVSVRDKYRNVFTVGTPLSFVTGPLPANMPAITLLTNNVEEMEPGYTLFRVQNNTSLGANVTIADNAGEVVWYGVAGEVGGAYGPIPTPSDIQQLTNGNLFFMETSGGGFAEVNMLGQTVETWTAPSGYTVNSHEDLMTGHGTIIYLNYFDQEIADFPTSATDSNAPTATSDVTCGKVVEISATNSALLNTWTLIDMLDPVRIDYLCFLLVSEFGIDAEHANAVVEDTNDNSLIVSMRNQDAVVKFTRAGQIKWILGPHENWGPEWQPYLLTPVGPPFVWNYGQHAPILTPQGTLLMFDDGNERAEPFAPPVPDQDNFSRAAEFSIDETNMQVSLVWQFNDTNEDRLYAGLVGNAAWLPQTGNVLVTYGAASYENGQPVEPTATNATIVRIKEVTHQPDPTVVFDLELNDPGTPSTNSGGYLVYRSHRIPDLYPHPSVPVPNLTVLLQDGLPTLQFTADPVRTYAIQASQDLVNWQEIGEAVPDDASGDFSFQDVEITGLSVQYYRVLTE